MQNRVANLLWSAVTLAVVLTLLDVLVGTATASALIAASWATVQDAAALDLVSLVKAGAVLIIVTSYVTVGNYAKNAITGFLSDLWKLAGSIADSFNLKDKTKA